eukprot:GHUV01017663.1.p3 GENE.GHUV01017663.1~~GHUV01017663.1.p3  ORF type:complete len:114 (-),score=35.89 GHUV01017663.1:1106-1447(-)
MQLSAVCCTYRRLLRNAAVQLQDSYGNPAATTGIPVRFRLLLSDTDAAAIDEVEAPQLCCSVGETQLKTDENGRAFFGDVGVEQDTGRMVGALIAYDWLMMSVHCRRNGSVQQ